MILDSLNWLGVMFFTVLGVALFPRVLLACMFFAGGYPLLGIWAGVVGLILHRSE